MNPLPISTSSAPKINTASIYLPVAIAPAAITGIDTFSFTAGIKTKLVVSSLSLWRPASNTSATAASHSET